MIARDRVGDDDGAFGERYLDALVVARDLEVRPERRRDGTRCEYRKRPVGIVCHSKQRTAGE